MTNPSPAIKDRGIVSDEEFHAVLEKVLMRKDSYRKLRTLCILVILWKVGKRESEIIALKREDVEVVQDAVKITFTLLKKRRLERAVKTFPNDQYLQHILNYVKYFDQHLKTCVYLFPSTYFSAGSIAKIIPSRHIDRHTVWATVKECSPTLWPHLFRETEGGKIVQQDQSILTPYKVARRLDIDPRTAFRYMQRYAEDKIEAEGSGAS